MPVRECMLPAFYFAVSASTIFFKVTLSALPVAKTGSFSIYRMIRGKNSSDMALALI